MSQTVAFVGLGAMGAGMARCLVRAGFSVRGYDVREERIPEGVARCRSSAEAAEGADAAVVIVLTADQAEAAVFGQDGLAKALRPNAPIICSTTMSPPRACSLAERALQRGWPWLDAPVSGGTERAVEGDRKSTRLNSSHIPLY